MLHIYFALVLSVPVVGVAQESQATVNTPQLVTSASAEVELKPDRASISFTVESRGPTAARAGAESARRQRAVLDTLRALGVAADQVQTAAIQINPEYANSGPNSAARVTETESCQPGIPSCPEAPSLINTARFSLGSTCSPLHCERRAAEVRGRRVVSA